MIPRQKQRQRHSRDARATEGDTHREPGLGTSVVAWLLLAMAIATFAPCVLLPEWRAYQSVCLAKQEAQFRVDAMRTLLDRERRLIAAIQTDPAVVTRLARREFPYRNPGDEIVTIVLSAEPAHDVHSFKPQPVELPPSLAQAAKHLPDLDYDGLFCDDRTRLPLMAMSIGLVGVGVWLPRRNG